jgi:hypothetical protein
MARVGIHSPENNINVCQLVLEEAHYHTFFVSQKYRVTRVNMEFLEFGILKFWYFKDESEGDYHVNWGVGLCHFCFLRLS